MSGNFEGIKKQKFGVEIECTGLTRADAAKAISKVLGGSPEHLGGGQYCMAASGRCNQAKGTSEIRENRRP